MKERNKKLNTVSCCNVYCNSIAIENFGKDTLQIVLGLCIGSDNYVMAIEFKCKLYLTLILCQKMK